MTQNDAMDAQLAKIGMQPDDLKYVVLGHTLHDLEGYCLKWKRRHSLS